MLCLLVLLARLIRNRQLTRVIPAGLHQNALIERVEFLDLGLNRLAVVLHNNGFVTDAPIELGTALLFNFTL